MKVIEKDILTVAEGYIFHQVDVTYAMGTGLAKQIRDKWPRLDERVRSARPTLGRCYVFQPYWQKDILLYVVSLVAQATMGRTGKHTLYWAFVEALQHFRRISLTEPSDCYFPWGIGCGLGGGNWAVVRALIEEQFPEAIICRRV